VRHAVPSVSLRENPDTSQHACSEYTSPFMGLLSQ
jgi:hypothetical protein